MMIFGEFNLKIVLNWQQKETFFFNLQQKNTLCTHWRILDRSLDTDVQKPLD